MSRVICIAGESGSGKTTSMRNLDPKSTYYIDADKKGLSSDHCMDAIRYVVMGVWKRLKHWLPREVQDDKADILTKEVRDDEYL